MRKTGFALTAVAAAFAALAMVPDGLAAKGSKGGGKPGGGDPPPAGPAEIAFARKNGSGLYDLMVCAANGSGVTTVLANAGNAYTHADWSADGDWIVFQGLTSGPGIYKIRPDGTGLAKLAAVSSATFPDGPDWSPKAAADGSEWIVFPDYVGPGGEPDLFIVRPDGTGLRNLTGSAAVSDGSSAWSPDVDALAVKQTDASGVQRIVVYDVTSLAGVLTLGATPDDVTGSTLASATNLATLDWSPAGGALIVDAIIGSYGGWYDLWSIDLSTGVATNLTATSGVSESDPAFGPSGTRVVFRYSGKSGKTRKSSGLWTADADGSNDAALLKDGDAVNPAWKR